MQTLTPQQQRLVQLVEQATSDELKAPNSQFNTELINEINSKADLSRDACRLLKKKLQNHNQPKVVFLALIAVDMAMQKCGNPFHVQVCTREFMNVLIQLLHNKDLLVQIHNKVLNLIEQWGKRFERDHDILPLFFDVYKALLNKGTEFPANSSINSSSQPQQSAPKQRPQEVISSKKQLNYSDLAPKYQKVIKDMNLLKGNINLANEMLDSCKSRQQLKENEICIDLLKTFKGMEPKIFELIQSLEDEEVLAVCLLVNEDMQKTFKRFEAIKNNKLPDDFIPGEIIQKNTIQYLQPSSPYNVGTQPSSLKTQSGNFIDLLSSSGPSISQTQNIPQPFSQPLPMQGNPFMTNQFLPPQQNYPPAQQFYNTVVPQTMPMAFAQQAYDPFSAVITTGPNPLAFQPPSQPAVGANQVAIFAPNSRQAPRSGDDNDPNMPSFLKKQVSDQQQTVKIEDLKNLNASAFTLGAVDKQQEYQNQLNSNPFAKSSRPVGGGVPGAEFYDLFQFGTQVLKDVQPEEAKKKRTQNYQYNPIDIPSQKEDPLQQFAQPIPKQVTIPQQVMPIQPQQMQNTKPDYNVSVQHQQIASQVPVVPQQIILPVAPQQIVSPIPMAPQQSVQIVFEAPQQIILPELRVPQFDETFKTQNVPHIFEQQDQNINIMNDFDNLNLQDSIIIPKAAEQHQDSPLDYKNEEIPEQQIIASNNYDPFDDAFDFSQPVSNNTADQNFNPGAQPGFDIFLNEGSSQMQPSQYDSYLDPFADLPQDQTQNQQTTLTNNNEFTF